MRITTPGPWEAKGGSSIWSGPYVLMQAINLLAGPQAREQHQANLALMSAAPELLEWAEAYLLEVDTVYSDIAAANKEVPHLEELRAAIAKAKGE
jgi:hypothetical protein